MPFWTEAYIDELIDDYEAVYIQVPEVKKLLKKMHKDYEQEIVRLESAKLEEVLDTNKKLLALLERMEGD